MQVEDQSVLAGRKDVTAIVSDIDGTIAHYAKSLISQGYEEATEQDHVAYKDSRRREGVQTSMEVFLEENYSIAERAARFAGITSKYLRHKSTGTVLKLYQLYNLSLSNALISEDTILLMELLQRPEKLYADIFSPDKRPDAYGVLCILITGARTSTFHFRRGSGALPHTCFDACEGGGKIWCRLQHPETWLHTSSENSTDPVAEKFFPFSEHGSFDHAWLETFYSATGYRGSKEGELPERSFPMWRLEDELNKEGYKTDHRDFDTSFQIYVKESPCVGDNLPKDKQAAFPRTFPSSEVAELYLRQVFKDEYLPKYGVTLHINLNRGQVNAHGCGKKEAMFHILDTCQKTMTSTDDDVMFCPENTVAMFDDANDLPFAEQCGVGLIPSVAHNEVLDHPLAVSEMGTRWFRPPIDGPLGSEWALWQIVLFKRNQLRQKMK